jgi:hypothetical protein
MNVDNLRDIAVKIKEEGTDIYFPDAIRFPNGYVKSGTLSALLYLLADMLE